MILRMASEQRGAKPPSSHTGPKFVAAAKLEPFPGSADLDELEVTQLARPELGRESLPSLVEPPDEATEMQRSQPSGDSGAAPHAPGTVLGDRYRIERELATGGMGTVYQATHLTLDAPVAIKVLRRDAVADAECVMRFVHEGKAAARLQSEHVARVFDLGTDAGGAPYLVMEFLQGSTFAELIAERGPPEPEEAVELVLQALAGLAAVHAAGIVHRDIKPENITVVRRENGTSLVKVLDFGLSKVVRPVPGAASASLTRAAVLLGTPSYISPEQYRDPRAVDARADIWSIGAVLYELITGKAPFEVTAAMAHFGTPPRPLRDLNPAVAPELERVVLRCLQPDPSARFQSAAELAAALSPFVRPEAPRDERPAAEPVLEPAVASPGPEPRLRLLGIVSIVALSLALIAALLLRP